MIFNFITIVGILSRSSTEYSFSNYPLSTIAPYFGSPEDFLNWLEQYFGDNNKSNLFSMKPIPIIYTTKQSSEDASTQQSKGNATTQQSRPDTSTRLSSGDVPIHILPLSASSNDLSATYVVISPEDIWATVPLANESGFVMPIVPPLEKLPNATNDQDLESYNVTKDDGESRLRMLLPRVDSGSGEFIRIQFPQ